MNSFSFKSKQELIFLSLSEGIDLFNNVNYNKESIRFLKEHLDCTYEQAYLYIYFINNNLPENQWPEIEKEEAYQLMKIARSGHSIEGFLDFSSEKLMAIRRAIKYNLLDVIKPSIKYLSANSIDFIISCELKGIPYLTYLKECTKENRYPIYIQIYNHFIKNNLPFPIHDELIYFKTKNVWIGLNKGLTMNQIHDLLENNKFNNVSKYDKDFYEEVIPYLPYFKYKDVKYNFVFDLVQKGLSIEFIKDLNDITIEFLYLALKQNLVSISDCEKLSKLKKIAYLDPIIKPLFIKDYLSKKYDESFFNVIAVLNNLESYKLVTNTYFIFKNGDPIDMKKLYHLIDDELYLNFEECQFLTGLALLVDQLQGFDDLKKYYMHLIKVGDIYIHYMSLSEEKQKILNKNISIEEFCKNILKLPLYIIYDINTAMRAGEKLPFLPLLLKATPEELFNYHVLFNNILYDYILDYLIDHPSAINYISWIIINVKCKDDLLKIPSITNPEQLGGGL